MVMPFSVSVSQSVKYFEHRLVLGSGLLRCWDNTVDLFVDGLQVTTGGVAPEGCPRARFSNAELIGLAIERISGLSMRRFRF